MDIEYVDSVTMQFLFVNLGCWHSHQIYVPPCSGREKHFICVYKNFTISTYFKFIFSGLRHILYHYPWISTCIGEHSFVKAKLFYRRVSQNVHTSNCRSVTLYSLLDCSHVHFKTDDFLKTYFLHVKIIPFLWVFLMDFLEHWA